MKKTIRILRGTVVSDRMDKTIKVKVERKFMHPGYGKIVRTFKKYSAHDEANSAQMGDTVDIIECRPLSRTKHMMLHAIVSKG